MLKRRQKVLSRIDEALAQLESGEINPPRGSYQTRDNFNGVRVQLKYGQRALTIDGRDHWFVEDAASFFSSAREAVERGELDGAIIDAVEGKDKGQGAHPAPKGMPLAPAPKSKSPEPARASIATVTPAASPSAPAAVTAAASPVVSPAARYHAPARLACWPRLRFHLPRRLPRIPAPSNRPRPGLASAPANMRNC